MGALNCSDGIILARRSFDCICHDWQNPMAPIYFEHSPREALYFPFATPSAASVATRLRSLLTLPLPSGWTRLERKITAVSEGGSIQIDVPVKPVWPKPAVLENRSPRLPEYAVATSQPSERNPSPFVVGTTRGFGEAEAEQVANLIVDVLEAPDDEANLARVREQVSALCARFPVYRR